MINNRQQQAGRRRGRGGNGNGGPGGNAPRQGAQGRSDNGNRIDNRSRGNANQLYEKYKNLASDAQRQGDRVNTEYYLQFADHYFRVLSDQRGRFEEQPPRRQQPDFDIDGNDDDYGDEGEPIRAGEQQNGQQNGQQGDQQPRQDARGARQDRESQYRESQDRGDRQMPERQSQEDQYQQRPVDDRAPQDRGDQRQERSDRQDRPERQRDTRRVDGDRPERPRRWDRDDRPPQQEGETEVAGQHRADPIAPGEDLERRAEAVIAADAPLAAEPAPRRRGRPRREATADPSAAETAVANPQPAPVVENGVDADRLPPALGATLGTAANDAGDDAPKPRRRRIRALGTGDASAD